MVRGRVTPQLLTAARTLEEQFEEIVADYLHRLCTSGSPLIVEADSTRRLKVQARGVLRETTRVLRNVGGPSEAVRDGLAEGVGEEVSPRGAHPGISLRAVLALSEAAVMAVARNLPSSGDPRDVAGIVLTIQRSIAERAARASVSYVDYLLRKLHEAHQDERSRVGQELRGEVAHGLAVISHCLELRELLEGENPLRAGAKLSSAKEVSQDTLRRVKEMSDGLQPTESYQRFESSLSELLRDNLPPTVRPWLSAQGDQSLVPGYVRGELVWILRDLLRYVGEGVVEVRLRVLISPTGVTVTLEGDRGDTKEGAGNLGTGSRAKGLEPARERLSLLGGTLEVEERAECRIRLTVDVPLAGEARETAGGTYGATVLLADHHQVFRKSVCEILSAGAGVTVVGEARDTLGAAALLQDREPDVVVLDLELPPAGAKEAIRTLSEDAPRSRIVVLSMHSDPELARELLEVGASACVAKDASRQELVAAILAAARGQSSVVLSVPRTGQEPSKQQTEEVLSDRQLEILRFAARGMSNKRIAGSLHITEATVKRHLANIYDRLGVGSRKEAARKALVEGLL